MRGNFSGFVKPVALILLAVVVVVVIFFVIAGSMGSDRNLGQAVDFTATDSTGKTVILSEEYAKSGVALMFFDRAQSDGKVLLTNMAAAAEGKDVTTILVALGEKNGEDITAYLNENGLKADVILPDGDGKIAEIYNVTACPITYFIAVDGSVRGVSLSNLTPSAAAKYLSYIEEK